MRALTEEETKTLFTKLASYTGRSLLSLVAPPNTDPSHPSASSNPADQSSTSIPPPSHTQHVFRLHGTRVFYMPLTLANLATSIANKQLISVGTCIGKFTKTGKFRINIMALNIIAPHARYKVWIKPNGEGPFTYGGHVVKAHVARWSEEILGGQGIVVMNSADMPLGFGVTARSTAEAKKLDPTAVVVFRQADVGEYLRDEDTLFTTT